MKHTARIIAIIMTLCLILTMFSACGAENTPASSSGSTPAAANGDTIVLKAAAQGAEDHAFMLGMRYMEQQLKERSDGRIDLQIYPNASLGNERETIEATIMGSIDMTIVTADAVVPSWVPNMQVLSIPYLFATREEAYDAIDNFLGPQFEEGLGQNGMTCLGYMELGFRHFTNNKAAINSAADMKGMVIRVQEAPIWFSLIEALGGTPTPVAFTELYSSMQQGVVDGQENPLSTIVSQKYYEVQKYLVLDGHTYAAGSLLMNLERFNSLSPEDQQLLTEVAAETVEYQRQLISTMDEEYVQTCKDNRMVVVESPDLDSFVEATKGIVDKPEVQALFDTSIVNDIRNYLSK